MMIVNSNSAYMSGKFYSVKEWMENRFLTVLTNEAAPMPIIYGRRPNIIGLEASNEEIERERQQRLISATKEAVKEIENDTASILESFV